jgi:hypothetical protein
VARETNSGCRIECSKPPHVGTEEGIYNAKVLLQLRPPFRAACFVAVARGPAGPLLLHRVPPPL